jgi:hypothetical protein
VINQPKKHPICCSGDGVSCRYVCPSALDGLSAADTSVGRVPALRSLGHNTQCDGGVLRIYVSVLIFVCYKSLVLN